MDPQRRLLRAMLWLLGISAAAGVLTIFLSTRVMGRVAGTTLVAAVATALAMPVSRMFDEEKKRLAGMVGLWAIVLSFVLALVGIWVDLAGVSWDLGWRYGLTAMLTCAAGLIACNLIPRTGVPSVRFAVRLMLAVDVFAFGLYGAAIWEAYYDVGDKLAATASYVLASGVTAAFALIGVGLEPRLWRWVGVVAGAAALAMGIAGTWFIESHDASAYITAMAVAVVVAHAIVVLRVPMGESGTWARLAAIGSTGAAGACVSVLAMITGGFDTTGPDALNRLTGAMGIVSACSTLAIVVLYRLHKRPPGTSAEVTAITSVQIVCPHCGRKASAPLGEAPCVGCGLLITVKVREPRCTKCDYPLLDLHGSVCPECGTARTAG